MPTYSGVHVLAPGDSVAEIPNALVRLLSTAFEKLWTKATIETAKESLWIAVILDDEAAGPPLARGISRELHVQTVCLVAESTSDAIGFWRFENGEEVRCLVRGLACDRIWEIARGRPEPWEEEILFSAIDPDRFAQRLPTDEAPGFLEVYRNRLLEPGNTYPLLGSRDLPAIMRALGIAPNAERTIKLRANSVTQLARRALRSFLP